MTVLRYAVVLFSITLAGHGQAGQGVQRANLSNETERPVRRLYQQLVSQPIGGIPKPERMKLLAPNLSDSLLHRIAEARACGDDWFRTHPRAEIKAPFEWLEFGLFSGADDRSAPQTFQIEKTESEADGVTRVYVRLTEGPPKKPWTWEVADNVIRENGRFVVDDVIFLRDRDIDTESRLSEILARGCDGSRYVGP
jgi:hypothetical protein